MARAAALLALRGTFALANRLLPTGKTAPTPTGFEAPASNLAPCRRAHLRRGGQQ